MSVLKKSFQPGWILTSRLPQLSLFAPSRQLHSYMHLKLVQVTGNKEGLDWILPEISGRSSCSYSCSCSCLPSSTSVTSPLLCSFLGFSVNIKNRWHIKYILPHIQFQTDFSYISPQPGTVLFTGGHLCYPAAQWKYISLIHLWWNSWSLTPPTLGFPQGENPKRCAAWDCTKWVYPAIFPPL